MRTEQYETIPRIPGTKPQDTLRTLLTGLGLIVHDVRCTPKAVDKIRFQVYAVQPGGEPMQVHGLSFLTKCIQKGMTIQHQAGAIWHAVAIERVPTRRERIMRPIVPMATEPQKDVVPWGWETNEDRALNCANFLKTHGYMASHPYEVVLVAISRRSTKHD